MSTPAAPSETPTRAPAATLGPRIFQMSAESGKAHPPGPMARRAAAAASVAVARMRRAGVVGREGRGMLGAEVAGGSTVP